MERFLLWPLIQNMLNGWLCHVTCTLLVILAFPINPWLTQLWYWPCLPFTSDFAYSVTCWHSPPISCLCHWEKICTFWSYGKSGTFKTSSSPRQFWGTLSLVVNLSLCGMPGGVLGADHWSLLSLTLAERRRRRQRKRRAVENEPDKGPETDRSEKTNSTLMNVFTWVLTCDGLYEAASCTGGLHVGCLPLPHVVVHICCLFC